MRRSRRPRADGSPYKLRLVAHDRQAYDWYYNVVANPMLWFVQHSLWELPYAPRIDAAFHRAWAEGYVAVNASFAAAVEAELERTPDAAVFFHDYHLYLAPRMVRERRPNAALMHFVHIPWPQPDYWRILPEERAVRDPRRADRQRHHRLPHRAVAQQLHLQRARAARRGRHGEDRYRARSPSTSPEFVELAQSEPVLSAEREILADRPEKLVVRVDRTDPSKNIVRGFRAFELYLDAHPEMHRRVGMLALLDPSRQDIPGVCGVPRRDST